MSEDWMRPMTKPLPGPVPTEEKQMSPEELERVVRAVRAVEQLNAVMKLER